MNWDHFQDYGEGEDAAFENMCCELFSLFGISEKDSKFSHADSIEERASFLSFTDEKEWKHRQNV